MDPRIEIAAAVAAAVRLAEEHGAATTALNQTGVELPDPGRFDGAGDGYRRVIAQAASEDLVAEGVALGFLAGRLNSGMRHRTPHDVTSFLMDRDLVVREAAGESILRLPWFEQELFVGRQLPDVSEIPSGIRSLAVRSYRAALSGERNVYSFVSYGHGYSVDAVPVRNHRGCVEHVMAIATPRKARTVAASAAKCVAHYEQAAAIEAERRAADLEREGRRSSAAQEARRAERARRAAARARIDAALLEPEAQDGGPGSAPLTAREHEVLALASHGLSYAEIAEELVLTAATVKTHFAHIYRKLRVPDKAAAVAWALRHGLIA
jgi:DNA-binding CsgD family transcriptional regulator